MSRLEDIVAARVADAKRKAAAKAEKAQKRAESSAKFQQEQREERRKTRERELRKRRNKGGMEIAQQFVETVAPHFVAMMQRDDADKLRNIRIMFRPYKSDQGRFSAEVSGEGGSRNFPGGTLTNAATKHGTDDAPGWLVARLMKKLQDETGQCRYGTHAEALEEILLLKQQLAAAQARIKSLEGEQPSPADAFEVKAQSDDDAATSGDTNDNIDDDDAEASTEDSAVEPSDVPAAS